MQNRSPRSKNRSLHPENADNRAEAVAAARAHSGPIRIRGAGPGGDQAATAVPAFAHARAATGPDRSRAPASIDGALSVLLVEDNPGDGALVRALLRELNPEHRVTGVTRLSAALLAIEYGTFDLLIADLTLPDSRGVATVTRLLSGCASSKPLIVLTGHADEVIATQAVKVGAQDYLIKTELEPDTFGRSIRYALERHRAHLDLHRLLRINPDGVLVLAVDSTILFSNPSVAAMLQSAPEDLLGTRFCVPVTCEGESETTLPSGAWVEMRAVATDWEGEDAFVVALRDITERRRTESKLAYLAHYDQLTGLANRTLFRERLARTLVHAAREERGFAIFALDLDRFKSINDSLGHDAGDALLVEVGARLKNATREADTVARLGGDEFALIAEGVEDASAAATVSDKIIAAFQPPFLIGSRTLNITTSVGVAMYPNDGETEAKLLVGADSAMYRAKKHGRNTYCFFDHSSHELTIERVRMESELHDAFAKRQLDVHYQPVYRLGQVIGAEALLRWDHPEQGMIRPGDFVSLLEHGGLIVDVGAWVLRTACEQIREWRCDEFPNMRVGVNVSPRQLLDDGFVETVTRALADSQLSPDALELEVTESMLMNETGRTAAALEALHKLGVRIALDDFGTGYSSLAHLSRLPAISTIKIDQSFVHGIGEDTTEGAIVTAIIGLARSLGHEVIAEGVETHEQLAYLRSQGCSVFQGYLFGRARAAAAWEDGGATMQALVSESSLFDGASRPPPPQQRP